MLSKKCDIIRLLVGLGPSTLISYLEKPLSRPVFHQTDIRLRDFALVYVKLAMALVHFVHFTNIDLTYPCYPSLLSLSSP